MIAINHVVKTFHTGNTESVVLKDLTFTIPTGQFLAITGKSGSGKSTTLYQISLLDRPTAGTITIDGIDVTTLSDAEQITYRRNHFGFIFQDYALLPTLTALENVMLPLLMQGIETKQASKQATEALTQVDLAEKLTHLPNQLSGGQQQRVSIARSIVHNPTILFADEPTANLDTQSSQAILKVFLELNKKKKLTIVMVTHELDYAAITDRTIELLDGEIIKDTLHKKIKRT